MIPSPLLTKAATMNAIIKNHSLKPGDEIIVPKSIFNIIQHHAVYIGYDDKGKDWIIENIIHVGVRLISADEFFEGVSQINKIMPFTGTNEQRKILVQKALRSIGRAYDLINFNCEHFTTHLRTGIPESKQVKNVVMAFLGLIVFSVILSD